MSSLRICPNCSHSSPSAGFTGNRQNPTSNAPPAAPEVDSQQRTACFEPLTSLPGYSHIPPALVLRCWRGRYENRSRAKVNMRRCWLNNEGRRKGPCVQCGSERLKVGHLAESRLSRNRKVSNRTWGGDKGQESLLKTVCSLCAYLKVCVCLTALWSTLRARGTSGPHDDGGGGCCLILILCFPEFPPASPLPTEHKGMDGSSP